MYDTGYFVECYSIVAMVVWLYPYTTIYYRNLELILAILYVWIWSQTQKCFFMKHCSQSWYAICSIRHENYSKIPRKLLIKKIYSNIWIGVQIEFLKTRTFTIMKRFVLVCAFFLSFFLSVKIIWMPCILEMRLIFDM